MFFGEVIEQQNLFQISTISKDKKALKLTNAVLDIAFSKAELYLRSKNKDILLARLNPNILQSNLNVLIDVQQNPSLITKNGNVHVCGHFIDKSLAQDQSSNLVSESIINTNKKINQLLSQHIKESPVSKESTKQDKNQPCRQENQKNQESSQNRTLRQSSRLFTRRISAPVVNSQKIKETQKFSTLSKKDVKSEKKKQKSESLLNNGRYSLKALLENIDDDDQDSDEQFSNSGEEESDDDSQFEEDQPEQDEDTISKSIKSQNKLSSRNIKRSKQEDEINSKGKQEKERKSHFQQKQKTPSLSSALKSHFKPQIQIGQQEDSESKKQINTQQYQQKWPQVIQSQVEKEANERQQKISQLAAKIKCPTKKPTI